MAYRDSTKYERMARLAIDIYIDYNITEFPTNAKDIAKRSLDTNIGVAQEEF